MSAPARIGVECPYCGSYLLVGFPGVNDSDGRILEVEWCEHCGQGGRSGYFLVRGRLQVEGVALPGEGPARTEAGQGEAQGGGA